MILFLLFVLGINVGSFLNVCIWRLPRRESIVQPPSHCPRCDTRLSALDLVPLLSQVLLRARCRYCGARISWRYFGVELLTGVLFLLVGTQPGYLDGNLLTGVWAGDSLQLLRDLIFVAALVAVFWIDYDTRLIQIEAVLLLGLAGLALDAWQTVHGQSQLVDLAPLLPAPVPGSLLALVVAAGFTWLCREIFSWIYGKEALGFGDVILVGGIAANLGWSGILFTFFFLSVVVGAAVGVLLQIPRSVRAFLWASKRHRRNSAARNVAFPLARHAFRKAIPFGPMLALGGITALLYGARLNSWYLSRFANVASRASTSIGRAFIGPVPHSIPVAFNLPLMSNANPTVAGSALPGSTPGP